MDDVEVDVDKTGSDLVGLPELVEQRLRHG
jgi:hypothetical protein